MGRKRKSGELMTFSGPLEDRILIRELVETYNDAVNRRDSKLWASVWSEDAYWNLMGLELSGKDIIVQTWEGAMSGFSYVGFSAFPGAIEVDGKTASARIYVRETLITSEGQTRLIEGLYLDKLKKINGDWKFTHRVYDILHEHNNTEV